MKLGPTRSCMFSLAAAVLAGAMPVRAAVHHVDADAPPGGDGSTWGLAFRYVQDALSAAAELHRRATAVL